MQLPLGDCAQRLQPGRLRQPARGSFSVDTAKASQPTTPENRGSYIAPGANGGGGFVKDIAGDSGGDLPAPGTDGDGRPTTFGVPGLSFPFLDDASQIFGLLVGKDAVLIRWDAGTMEASAGLSWDFGPIMVGPVPITISIGGEIGIRGRFAIGYDTVGIRKLIDGGNAAALLDGIFIDDLDAQGNDVNELEFFGRVWAGASVDLVIISAGRQGRHRADVRAQPQRLARPRRQAAHRGDPRQAAEPDLPVRRERTDRGLPRRVREDRPVLLHRGVQLRARAHHAARVVRVLRAAGARPGRRQRAGNVLYLNVGSRAGTRNVKVDELDEKLEVRQLSADGDVRVSGYGIEETADDVDLIVFDAGNGDDEILFLPGGEDKGKSTIPFTVPVAGSGGPGVGHRQDRRRGVERRHARRRCSRPDPR